MGIVKKSGAWFTYEGEQLGQGREKAKDYLKQNPEVMMEISDKVLTAAGLRPSDEEPEAEVTTTDRRRVHRGRRSPHRPRLTPMRRRRPIGGLRRARRST